MALHQACDHKDGNFERVVLVIDPGEDADAEEVSRLALQLRDELRSLDVEDVTTPTSASAPPGSKSTDIMTWGTLFVSLGAAAEVLPALVNVVQGWRARHDRRSITLEFREDKLVLTGASLQQMQPIVDQWLERHTGK